MPIYEFRCNACKEDFEELVFKDGESVACPQCGSMKTEKLMSCCRFKTGGGGVDLGGASAPSSSSSSCAGCSGGSCATCH